MEQDHKTITVDRPTGPRITAEEPKSIGQLVSIRAKSASRSIATVAVTATAAAVSVLTRHKFATAIGASAITAVATHFVVAIMMMGIITNNTPGGATPYSGPGDIQTTNWKYWGGLRAFSLAKAGTKAASICDAATATVCTDVNTLANGNFDVATAAALTQCSVSCVVNVLYDQSGATSCTGPAACTPFGNITSPVLTFNCVGTLPCMTFTPSKELYGNGTASDFSSTQTQPFSMTMVAQTTSGGSFQDVMGDGNVTGAIQIGFSSSANTILMYAGSVITATGFADSSRHVINGMYQGASSKFRPDDIDQGTVNPGAASLSGVCFGNCANGLTGIIMEGGIMSGDQTANFTALCHNERLYWGTAGSC